MHLSHVLLEPHPLKLLITPFSHFTGLVLLARLLHRLCQEKESDGLSIILQSCYLAFQVADQFQSTNTNFEIIATKSC